MTKVVDVVVVMTVVTSMSELEYTELGSVLTSVPELEEFKVDLVLAEVATGTNVGTLEV